MKKLNFASRMRISGRAVLCRIACLLALTVGVAGCQSGGGQARQTHVGTIVRIEEGDAAYYFPDQGRQPVTFIYVSTVPDHQIVRIQSTGLPGRSLGRAGDTIRFETKGRIPLIGQIRMEDIVAYAVVTPGN